MPKEVSGAPRVVVLLLDGLGWNQLQQHRVHMPTLASFTGSHITTVAPSTTATALTSLVTGLAPGEHGLIGYRIDMGDTVMNVLRWGDENGDLRRRYPPEQVQPCPPFLGLSVPVISKAELEGTGFTQAHLSGVKPMGWRAASSIPVTIRQALDSGETFVYAYYDGIDKIAHERGFGPYYEAELRAADALVAQIVSVLPTDTVLLVTADHGQVHVGDNTIIPSPSLMEHVDHQSGEGRFRWLHARRGREGALCDAAQQYGDVAWIVTRAQVLDEQWFGARVPDYVARRMGDVALVPFAPVSFEEPLDGGAFDLVCRHGSLTADEMLVPLLAYTAVK
jgi:predicted AlkP superfamily pyrophosphatase or phosphodiesterase